MKLQDFLAGDAPVELATKGFDDDLYCRVLSLDEMNSVLGDGANQLQIGARLLALCIVDKVGKPLTTVQNWLDLPFSKNERMQALIKDVSIINGLAQADEAAELGKSSEATGDSA